MSQLAANDIARSGITPDAAAQLGWFPTENARLLNLGFARVPALAIPYLDPFSRQPITYGERNTPFLRVRYLEDVFDQDGKLLRYTQPSASGVHAYFTPCLDWPGIFGDPRQPIVITEGEKKAASLCMRGVPCIGLGGVYNWRDKDDNLIPMLLRLTWRGRVVVICYDSDAIDNPNVRHAELALAAELQKLGAEVRLARLEHGQDGKKQGIDDYIAAGRQDVLMKLLETAEWVSTLELDVMNLNQQVAYLENEDMVYVIADDRKITKSGFTTGSQFSSLTTDVVKTVKGKPIPAKMPLAPLWLTHPGARRYAGTVFDPANSEREVVRPNGTLLNRWRGFNPVEGDVRPFLELTEFLLSRAGPEVGDLVLKLLAYKAQHPARKVPLALVFLGPQGCGKSLWARITASAFAPYNYAIPSKALKADFQPFLESSLMVVIDEAQSVHTVGAKEHLRTLISDQRQEINKKHVSQVQADTYCQFILTSNDRRVGAYDRDDRRMVVIDCPERREAEFYDRLVRWEKDNGPAHLIHYLLNYNLEGWQPPKHAPMTPEKYLAYKESLSPVQSLAETMVTADYNAVALWLDSAMSWSMMAEAGGNPWEQRLAREVRALASIQIRPWYRPEELALMFPAIVGQLQGIKRLEATAPGEISRQLRNAGVPYLKNVDDVRGFRWKGEICQFLIIADRAEWDRPITQSDFDRLMLNFPTYAARGLQRGLQRA